MSMYHPSKPLASVNSARVVARIHVTDGADLEFILDAGPAANGRPMPTPGMYRVETRTYYVTARGQVYLVRAPGAAVQLRPVAALPSSSALTTLDDAEYDRQLCILAEAADALDAESVEPGIYECEGHIYYVNGAGVHMLYGANNGRRYSAVKLPELPVDAECITDDKLNELPSALYDAIAHIDQRADVSPQALS